MKEGSKAAILAGKLQPFASPLIDVNGQTVVAAVTALPEADLWKMAWYAQGIVGRQP